MRDELTNLFAGMYDAGDISGCVLAAVPDGRLRSGWAEQAVIAKYISKEMAPKDYRDDYLVPIDRHVRIATHLGLAGHIPFMVVTGIPGAGSPRMVFLLVEEPLETRERVLIACVFWTTSLTLLETLLRLASVMKSTSEVHPRNDAVSDYLDRLMSDCAAGDTTEVISLQIPDSMADLRKQLRSGGLKGSGSQTLCRTPSTKYVESALEKLSSWLVSLEITERLWPVLTAVVSGINGHLFMFLWDSVRHRVSCARFSHRTIADMFLDYVVPMWNERTDRQEQEHSDGLRLTPHPEDESTEPISGPHVVVSHDVTQSGVSDQGGPYDAEIDIGEIESRLTLLETRLSSILGDNASAGIESAVDVNAMESVQERIRELMEQLETVKRRLQRIERLSERVLSRGEKPE